MSSIYVGYSLSGFTIGFESTSASLLKVILSLVACFGSSLYSGALLLLST